ncbi:MAG: hypothetical protein R3C16_11010 [Hyphomonadaceae bacterium]
MAEQAGSPYEREVRDTVVKSGLTGVAGTILAVTIFSPAGLGGMIGTSLAGSFGLDSNSQAADDVYASLPAYPAPLTLGELNDIRGQLASTAASLEITRAATDERIERVRAIAMSDGLVSYSQVEPTVVAAPAPRAVAAAPVQTAAADPVVEATPVSYAMTAVADTMSYRDPHLELAELLLAHESF